MRMGMGLPLWRALMSTTQSLGASRMQEAADWLVEQAAAATFALRPEMSGVEPRLSWLKPAWPPPPLVGLIDGPTHRLAAGEGAQVMGLGGMCVVRRERLAQSVWEFLLSGGTEPTALWQQEWEFKSYPPVLTQGVPDLVGMADGGEASATQGPRGLMDLSLIRGCPGGGGTQDNGALRSTAAQDNRGMGGGSAALYSLSRRKVEAGNAPAPMVVGAGDELG